MDNRFIALLIGAVGCEAITLALVMLLMNTGGLYPMAFIIFSAPCIAYCIDRISKL